VEGNKIMTRTRSRYNWQIDLLGDVTMASIGIFFLLPLIFSILMSFRPVNEPVNIGSIFVGSRITMDNYAQVLRTAPWHLHYVNSIIFVVGVLVVQLVTVTMAGYAFARLKFFGRNVLLMLILLQLMIPTAVLLVQNFATIRRLAIFDTHWALMMPYWGSAFGVLLLRQTFREIPYELEEAARIDGANLFQILRNIYIPLSIPAYLSFALVSITAHWNEVLWPLIVTRSEEVRPLTVALNKLYQATETGAQYSVLMAGTLMVIAPLVVLFLLFQRRFIESFAGSGLK
jgi:sn-glycerol 3-phosphate transport system permease protein